MPNSAQSILAQLVRIPSATGHEQAVAQAFAGRCEEAGLELEMQEVEPGRPNVIARWRVGRRPQLLLTGHLDTVPVGEGWTQDPFGAEVAGGRFYGRGACDMKSGLAAMLGAIVDLRARGAESAGDVVLAAVVGEEEDSAGTRALIARGVARELRGKSAELSLEIYRLERFERGDVAPEGVWGGSGIAAGRAAESRRTKE